MRIPSAKKVGQNSSGSDKDVILQIKQKYLAQLQQNWKNMQSLPQVYASLNN